MAKPLFDSEGRYDGQDASRFLQDKWWLEKSKDLYFSKQLNPYQYTSRDERPVIQFDDKMTSTQICEINGATFYHMHRDPECQSENQGPPETRTNDRVEWNFVSHGTAGQLSSQNSAARNAASQRGYDFTFLCAPRMRGGEVYWNTAIWRKCTKGNLEDAMAGTHRAKCPEGLVPSFGYNNYRNKIETTKCVTEAQRMAQNAADERASRKWPSMEESYFFRGANVTPDPQSERHVVEPGSSSAIIFYQMELGGTPFGCVDFQFSE